jgi:plasmid stabilization system protein ParE
VILFSSDALSDIERVRSFLDTRHPTAAERALAEIWVALERLEEYPNLGRLTDDIDVRQITVPFGDSGYVVRYCQLPEDGSLLVLRIWHGREARK